MSPIFEPDFTSVEASIPIHEGRFQVQVTKRTPFVRESTDPEGNTKVSAGIRYGLEAVGQFDEKGKLVTKDIKGKVVSPFTCWPHTEGGWKFSKPFLMAAAGYNVRNEENEANKELFQGHKWIFKGEVGDDPEKIELGDGWDIPVGRVVDVTLSKSVDKGKDGETYENQEYRGWTPVED